MLKSQIRLLILLSHIRRVPGQETSPHMIEQRLTALTETLLSGIRRGRWVTWARGRERRCDCEAGWERERRYGATG